MARSLVIWFFVACAFAQEPASLAPLQEGIDFQFLNDSVIPIASELIDYSAFQQVVSPGDSIDGGFWQASVKCQLDNVADVVQCLYNKQGQLTREDGLFKVEITLAEKECNNVMQSPKCFSSYMETQNGTVTMGVQYVKSLSKRQIRSTAPNSCRGFISARESEGSIQVEVFCGAGKKTKRSLWKKFRIEVEDKNLLKKKRKRSPGQEQQLSEEFLRKHPRSLRRFTS